MIIRLINVMKSFTKTPQKKNLSSHAFSSRTDLKVSSFHVCKK